MKNKYSYDDIAVYLDVGRSTAIETAKKAAKIHGFELPKGKKVLFTREQFDLIKKTKIPKSQQRCRSIKDLNRKNGLYHRIT